MIFRLQFRLQLAKFCTESVDESCDAIGKNLKTYDASVAMDMVPAGKSLEKAPGGVFKIKTTTPPSTNTSAAAVSFTPAYTNCRNCDQPGHAYYRCPSNCFDAPLAPQSTRIFPMVSQESSTDSVQNLASCNRKCSG